MTDSEELVASTVDVTMPRLSDSMEEATILDWLKQPGDAIRKGEPLVEVETDKATMVYEAEVTGVLAEHVVAEGETAALGAVIARVAVEGAVPGVAETSAKAPVEAAVVAPPTAAAPAAVDRAVPARGARARATPVARRLASELGVSLERVAGTGPGGRIVRADVRAAQAGNGGATAPATVETGELRGDVVRLELTATQRTIAQRMSASRSEIPDFTVEAEIDMEGAHRLREELRAAGADPVPSFNDLIVKAAALTLRDFPNLNAAYDGSSVLRYSRVNVGIAVATDDALLVPTIFDADLKSLGEIATDARRLSEKVRSRSVSGEELDGGTFTVSNLGMFGVRRFNAVINRPQVAILAVGEVALRPWVTPDGGITARRLLEVALSCDHRAVYGADGARFLQRFRELLDDPSRLDDRR